MRKLLMLLLIATSVLAQGHTMVSGTVVIPEKGQIKVSWSSLEAGKPISCMIRPQGAAAIKKGTLKRNGMTIVGAPGKISYVCTTERKLDQ